MTMKIYISGLYSGTNPQPGVGIARSLREAYPEAVLIGVEYSNRCSGIHWHDLDDVWLQRPWEELNLSAHAAEIRRRLDAGAVWISANDLEILWLSTEFPDGHPNLLTPPAAALTGVAKPAVTAHTGLPVKIPPFVTTDISDWDLHAFCRRYNWKVWLKGPYYEAVRIRNWTEFETTRDILASAWATEKLFLQAHVTGYEESVSFAAYRGELLSAVAMRKRDLTELGKTWAGDARPAADEIKIPLARIVREINWTGGAEIEMVRDADDCLWLLEINPRFPAWIHGATIGGFNLPAALVCAATGVAAQKSMQQTGEFTRVVLEIPVRGEFPLSPLPEPLAGGVGHSLKHPSGLIQFANRLHKQNGDSTREKVEHEPPRVPPQFVADIAAVNFEMLPTPAFLFLETTARQTFADAARRGAAISGARIAVNTAYSIKTNPDARLLQLAQENGFFAEAISPLEAAKALEIGFKPNQIILNGPGKWWRSEYLPREPLHAVFCDSLADLRRTAEAIDGGRLAAETVGVRLRTANTNSRFGVAVDAPDKFQNLIEAVKLLPSESKFGVHFHFASSAVGVGGWWHLFDSLLGWCAALEKLTHRKIEVLDTGGGWFPDDMSNGFQADFARAVARAAEKLPHVTNVICEPGKALAQPSMAVAMRILEIGDGGADENEVVVDGSIAELPMHFFYPHRVLYRAQSGGAWQILRRGKTPIFGRLCMEHDVLAAGVELPETAQAGDLLVFCDAGAYDRSMSYDFGRG